MTRPKSPAPEPGIKAKWNDECAIKSCDRPIVGGVSRVVFIRGRAAHVECYQETHE